MDVIIIDDDPIYRRVVEDLVREHGLTTVTAINGRSGLDLIRRMTPRVCIVDWMMPGLDGPTLMRELRRDPETQQIYAIMLTGKEHLHELVQAFDAGVDDFLRKPIHPAEFSARLRAAMRLVTTQEALDQQVQTVESLNSELVSANRELHTLATTDPLTGLPNRRAALEALERDWTRWERYGTPICVAMADIDHFKRVNDSHGHDAGDAVLRHVARQIDATRRDSDLAGRCGGEEFILGLPSQSIDAAAEAMRRMVEQVAADPLPLGDEQLSVTLSVGLAAADSTTPDLDALIRAADQALYLAKRSGRNRLCVAPTVAAAA